MASPKVSIVIPTRNRPDTIVASIKSAVAQDYANVEIIVSNNGSNEETRQVVESFRDPRIRHVAPPSMLSMSHNFEFAVGHVTGDWIILIGDDDGILPTGITRALSILHDSGADALASRNCAFRWPLNGEPQVGAYLTVPMGRGWRWYDSNAAIKKVLARDLSFNDTPTTYTGGMIKTEVYKRIVQSCGSFYRSQIPDVYSCFAVMSTIDRFVLSREPMMIAGLSHHSHGNASLSLGQNAFNKDANIPIHADLTLPEEGTFTFSIQAILYESYLQSACLRRGDPVTNMPEQLVAILAYADWFRTGPRSDDRVYNASLRWVRSMATLYGLDGDDIVRRGRLSPKQRLSQYRQSVADFVDRYVVDDRLGLRMMDVYEAGLYAEAIRVMRPAKLSSYRRTVARRMAR